MNYAIEIKLKNQATVSPIYNTMILDFLETIVKVNNVKYAKKISKLIQSKKTKKLKQSNLLLTLFLSQGQF